MASRPQGISDYFLKFEGTDIKGESKDAKHQDEIEMLSWSWGASQSGTFAIGGGGGAGKVAMQDFHFTMRLCKASPKLMQACATGEHIGKATLSARKAGDNKEQGDFLKVTFSDLLVSSYQTGGSGGDDPIPVDQISLNFAKVEIEYKEQDAKGTLQGAIKAGYDLKKMQKV
jgi:type VI secretion system secreted protein Hcp